MKNLSHIVCTILVLFFIAMSVGCARQHTVQVHDDKLTFYYRNPEATEVFFLYSVDNFQYQAASKGPRARWQITVPLYKEFTYFYIVDGIVTLPECPYTVLDDFGSKNCFYEYGM